jgi:transposase-like protein
MQTQPTSAKRVLKSNPAIRGRALIDDWQRSGLSRSAFARERQVGAHLLSYWVRRLGVTKPPLPAAVTSTGFIQVPLIPAEPATPPPATVSPSIEILFPRGVVLRVRPGVDAIFLQTVVTALEHVRC